MPARGSITLSIEARLLSGTYGATVTNQAQIFFDADGNGSNEATALSAAPGVGGPTVFGVAVLPEIPTLDPLGIVTLGLGLGCVAVRVLRRRRS